MNGFKSNNKKKMMETIMLIQKKTKNPKKRNNKHTFLDFSIIKLVAYIFLCLLSSLLVSLSPNRDGGKNI